MAKKGLYKKMNGELDNLKEKICKGEFSYLVYWYY